MTRIKIKKLIWDEFNVEHIKKHNVTKNEVGEVVKKIITHKKAKKGRYLIIGRIGLRMISVAVSRKGVGVYYPVMARDSAKKERKVVYEKEKI